MSFKNLIRWLFGKKYIDISKTKQLEKKGVKPFFSYSDKYKTGDEYGEQLPILDYLDCPLTKNTGGKTWQR